ncbi:N-6 DNA methylase [Prolixibacteraceae bacterium Z1-6]|uniref:N-6 DNA methylase n=1 Tax=Draconibacterium aestuarii TaxID=2998507 RepID=A0A9X3J5Q2_9BACT|nr:N-6 DNA methylase [Prolixibacteraceae bacterium Z1-6]
MKTAKQTFSQLMEQLARRHGIQHVFSDFMALVICAFSMGAKEAEYLDIINKYEKPEAYKLSEALGALVIEMTGDGTGMVDVLGKFFEENISHGYNGQFFTPQPICDMMACMNQPVRPLQRVLDPACGSGRMLMGMAKISRFAKFYGADTDINCARMTCINMYLNCMYGEVAWMNSLSNQYYGGWVIEPTVKGIHRIRQITERESYIHLKLPEETQKPQTPLPVIEIPAQVSATPKQGLLFEF